MQSNHKLKHHIWQGLSNDFLKQTNGLSNELIQEKTKHNTPIPSGLINGGLSI